MDDKIVVNLQEAIQNELLRRFDHEDAAMAEYIVVMLQNGKDAQALTEELSELISNYHVSFTTWIFEQIARLQSGQPVQYPTQDSSGGLKGEPDVDMDTDGQTTAHAVDQGMGYPAPRAFSSLKKTLQENSEEQPRSRGRPDQGGVRSTPYGSVPSGNGNSSIPTGPRADHSTARQGAAGPMRTDRGRDRGNKGTGPDRQNKYNAKNNFPEMPQMPGFPISPADFFANMPLVDRLGPLNGTNMQGMRPPSRRCTKWPTCFKGKACTFGHPTTICQNPACRRTDGSCTSIHGDEDIDLPSGVEAQRKTEEEQEAKALTRQNKSFKNNNTSNGGLKPTSAGSDGTMPICKFGEACTNRTCQFAHPSPVSKNGSSIVLNSESCNAGMSCTNEQCSFSHPSPSNKYTPGVKLNTAAAEVMCKFTPCLNPACRFQHAPGQKTLATFGQARNKVWTPNAPTAKITAERVFVSGEAEEQFNQSSNLHDNDTEMEK